MEEWDQLYPQYGFAKHKGYGTKAHYAAIQAHGILPIQPQELFEEPGGEAMKNQSGKAGEEHIARWLESQGYEILARNFHSRYGEIDIVAQRPPYIAFVEVKARVENSLVSPLRGHHAPEAAENHRHRPRSTCASTPAGCSPGSTRRRSTCRRAAVVGQEYLENAFWC